MAKKTKPKREHLFRMTYSQDDRERVNRLMARFCNFSEVCLFRVLIDRCMVRYPDAGSIDRKFLKECAKIQDQVLPTGETRIQTALELGAVYEGYVQAMYQDFGFDRASRFLRGILILAEEGVL